MMHLFVVIIEAKNGIAHQNLSWVSICPTVLRKNT